MPEAGGYVYRVGWLATVDRRSDERVLAEAGDDGDTVERLTILGDYRATTPKGAVEAALADGKNNGGVPGMESQAMVAIVKSKWSVFAGTGRQETVWDLEPVVDVEIEP